MRRIVCAAIKHVETGTIVCSVRHFDLITHNVIGHTPFVDGNAHWEQGFVDNYGKWVDREEAMRIAIESKQVVQKLRGPTELYSEDLY